MSLAWSTVKSLSIPVGGTSRDVKRVTAGGVVLWEKPSQIPYVTDGLVAWWDGEWNAGIGRHDNSALEWPDLMGSFKMTSNGSATWGGKSLTIGAETWPLTPKADFLTIIRRNFVSGQAYSFEMVLEHTFQSNKCIFGQHYKYSLDIHTSGVRELAWIGNGSDVYLGPSAGGKHSISFSASYLSGTQTAVERYYNGGNKATQTVGKVAEDQPTFGLGLGYGAYPGRGVATANIYCIRVYNRALTAAEVAANYAADRERFGL